MEEMIQNKYVKISTELMTTLSEIGLPKVGKMIYIQTVGGDDFQWISPQSYLDVITLLDKIIPELRREVVTLIAKGLITNDGVFLYDGAVSEKSNGLYILWNSPDDEDIDYEIDTIGSVEMVCDFPVYYSSKDDIGVNPYDNAILIDDSVLAYIESGNSIEDLIISHEGFKNA